jgi:tRNA A37 threonylcarbamoyladenosine modification protein TsaB
VVSDRYTRVSALGDDMLRGHGEALIPMVEEVLAEAGITYEHLDGRRNHWPRIVHRHARGACRGPRFSATLNIPLVGIGTLEAMA